MADIVTRPEQLPAKIEDLQEFVLVGKEAIKAQKAKIRAIKKVDKSHIAYKAALQDGQDIAEIVIDAEAKMGELMPPPKRSDKPGSGRGTWLPTLPSGVNKKQSHYAQVIARNPIIVQQEKAKAREKGELVTSGAVRAAIKKETKNISQSPVIEDGCTVADLESLIAQGKTFGTIYADPPWAYGNQATRSSTDNHYKTMTLKDIAALPIANLASDKAHLHLWTTNAFLFECPAIMAAWGFEYKSVFVWVKPQMGIGNYWRVSHEFLLLGVRGGVTFHDHGLMSWGQYRRGKHSVKPGPVRNLIEQASPGPRLELFGRVAQEGWTVWGDEISQTLFTQQTQAL